jgi:hypothetical protein
MPSTLVALGIVLVAILPGALYVWAYERQASAYGVTLADRTLRFIAVAVIFHLVLGWPEYALYRLAFTTDGFGAAQFAAAWFAILLLVVLPSGVGTTLGGLYASRSTRVGWAGIRNHLSPEAEDRLLRIALGRTPAPRAWDHLFSDRPFAYLRVTTEAGDTIAGLFSSQSYAGGFPHEADLLLEEAWQLSDDGETLEQPLGYPVYIAASQIAWVEIDKMEEGNHAAQAD